MTGYISLGIQAIAYVKQGYDTYKACKETYDEVQHLRKQNIPCSYQQMGSCALKAGVALIDVAILTDMTFVASKKWERNQAAKCVDTEENKFAPRFDKNNPRETWKEAELDDDIRDLLGVSPEEKVFEPTESRTSYETPEYHEARGKAFASVIECAESEIMLNKVCIGAQILKQAVKLSLG